MWAFWISFPSFPLPVTLFRTIPFYDLTIDRLSGKICTFAHVTCVYFATSKVTKEAEILQEGFSLIFLPCKTFTGSIYIVRARKRVMSWLGS